MLKKQGGCSKIIYDGLTEEDANTREIELIETLKSVGFELTNILNGGQSGFGLRHSDETKSKISQKSKLQWTNPEMRKKLCDSRKKTHNTEKFKSRISEVHKGKKLSMEHRKKISQGMRSKESLQRLVDAKTKYKDIIVTSPNGEVFYFENTKDVCAWFKSKGFDKASVPSVIRVLSKERRSLYKHEIKLKGAS